MQPNKALVGLVVGMGLVIVIGVAALVYGLVQRASNPSFKFFADTKPVAEAPKDGGQTNIAVPLPMGTSVVSVDRSGDLLMIHTVDEDDSSAVLFIDPNDGRIVRRITFGARR